ncbi:hypothetical protein CEXT_142911 [Caerostris extrusa]|uniref:Uncharacterized protein n=1 Tax=Caerostris extrusa TaxID=172846 RepID=A0AAV4RS24_CAEEX|nr:hypothetical protein CEXT_142911 [Caerostris extrusa]
MLILHRLSNASIPSSGFACILNSQGPNRLYRITSTPTLLTFPSFVDTNRLWGQPSFLKQVEGPRQASLMHSPLLRPYVSTWRTRWFEAVPSMAYLFINWTSWFANVIRPPWCR